MPQQDIFTVQPLHTASKDLPTVHKGGLEHLSCDIWDTDSPTGQVRGRYSHPH